MISSSMWTVAGEQTGTDFLNTYGTGQTCFDSHKMLVFVKKKINKKKSQTNDDK